MRKLLISVFLFSTIGLAILAACGTSGDDDDSSDDDAATDDTATDDDTTTDDDTNHWDDDTDDDADDTAADDDTAEVPWVDGGFDVDSWAPCATTGCSMFVYATVSDAFMLQSMSNLPTGGPIEQLVVWQIDGTATAGDIDLTLTPEKADPITTFVMIYVNATITTTINYEALYVSTGGTLHIDQIGQATGDPFAGEVQDATFTEAELQGQNLAVNFDGKSGTIDSILGSGTTLRMPLK